MKNLCLIRSFVSNWIRSTKRNRILWNEGAVTKANTIMENMTSDDVVQSDQDVLSGKKTGEQQSRC